jgi:hypothetical protein
VSENTPQDCASIFLDKAHLIKLRLKAVRSGVWFRALRRIDRVLVDLTIMVNTNVRSYTLASRILTVARRLEEALESKIVRAIREIGFMLAYKLSFFAQKWGHKGAWKWASDAGFARYLAVMKLNG